MKIIFKVAVKKLTATIQIFYLGLGLSRSARLPACPRLPAGRPACRRAGADRLDRK